jgi:hypothetical protein
VDWLERPYDPFARLIGCQADTERAVRLAIVLGVRAMPQVPVRIVVTSSLDGCMVEMKAVIDYSHEGIVGIGEDLTDKESGEGSGRERGWSGEGCLSAGCGGRGACRVWLRALD